MKLFHEKQEMAKKQTEFLEQFQSQFMHEKNLIYRSENLKPYLHHDINHLPQDLLLQDIFTKEKSAERWGKVDNAPTAENYVRKHSGKC